MKYERHEFRSADGTQVPIQLMTRRGTKPAFVYLYYYGAIGAPTLPTWDEKPIFQLVLELGGAVAIANVRGGGEFGLRWQDQDIRLHRRATLEDIAGAAERLKQEFPDTPIVASGRSYGGMHTLAAMVEAPQAIDLFVAEMPVSDPPGFLENGVFGRSAWDDFGFRHNAAGDLQQSPQDMEVLQAWSPAHHVAELRSRQMLLKPLLLATGRLDDRVEPYQTYGMAAELQEHYGPDAPVFLAERSDEAHSARTHVDVLTFIAAQLNIRQLTPLM